MIMLLLLVQKGLLSVLAMLAVIVKMVHLVKENLDSIISFYFGACIPYADI